MSKRLLLVALLLSTLGIGAVSAQDDGVTVTW